VIHGVLASVLAMAIALLVGFEYSARVGDERGLVAWLLGLLTLAVGLTWTWGV
jgi:hypothetical protein